MKYRVRTTKDLTNMAKHDTFIQASIDVKDDCIMWTFNSKREMNKAINDFINAGLTSVRRA